MVGPWRFDVARAAFGINHNSKRFHIKSVLLHCVVIMWKSMKRGKTSATRWCSKCHLYEVTQMLSYSETFPKRLVSLQCRLVGSHYLTDYVKERMSALLFASAAYQICTALQHALRKLYLLVCKKTIMIFGNPNWCKQQKSFPILLKTMVVVLLWILQSTSMVFKKIDRLKFAFIGHCMWVTLIKKRNVSAVIKSWRLSPANQQNWVWHARKLSLSHK